MAAPLLVPLSSVTNNKFQVHFNTTEGNTEKGKIVSEWTEWEEPKQYCGIDAVF